MTKKYLMPSTSFTAFFAEGVGICRQCDTLSYFTVSPLIWNQFCEHCECNELTGVDFLLSKNEIEIREELECAYVHLNQKMKKLSF